LIKDPSTPIFPNILHNINHLLKPAVLVLVSLTSLLCHVPPPRLQTAEGKVVCWLPLHAAPCSELIPDDARVGTLSYHMEGCFRMHMAQLTDGPPFLSGVENSTSLSHLSWANYRRNFLLIPCLHAPRITAEPFLNF
jgi:hypothetical protein